MNKEAPQLSLEVDSSVGNLFDKSTLYTVAWPMGKLVDTIKEAGYRGIEWHPLRIVAGAQMNAGLICKDDKDAIVSLHQSYRSEKNLLEAWRHQNRALALMSYVLLPERVSSLQKLEKLQGVLGKALPIVLYPSNLGEESGTDRSFAEKIFQPTSEIMYRWDVRGVDDLIEESRKRGYDGLCLDLFLMREKDIEGFGFNPWQEILPQLLPYTKELQVSAGRGDIPQEHIDTYQELENLLTDKGDSELTEMLEVIRSSGWKGRVVTEIPGASLHEIRKKNGNFTSMKDLIEDHKKIVGNIQDILG